MTLDLPTLGRRLAEARANAQLTQEAAAETLAVPRTAIVQIEAGRRNVTTLELAEFAKLYRVPVGDFFGPKPTEEDPLVALKRISTDIQDDPEVSSSIRRCLALFKEGVTLQRALERDPKALPPSYASSVADPAQAVEQGTAAAHLERKRLELGDAPIADICRLISEQGIWATGAELPKDGFSGLFLNHPTIGMALVVNHQHPLPRKRFSYAHEYAHALFDRDKTVTYTAKSNATELLERRANAFAAAFLVPAHGVSNFLESIHKGKPSRRSHSTYDVASDASQEVEVRTTPKSQELSFREVAALAHHFGVSYEVACYSLRDLGHINKEQRDALVANKVVGGAFVNFLQMGGSSDSPEAPDGRKASDDNTKELVSQIIPMALDAYDRAIISRGKLRELVVTLGLSEEEVLRFA